MMEDEQMQLKLISKKETMELIFFDFQNEELHLKHNKDILLVVPIPLNKALLMLIHLMKDYQLEDFYISFWQHMPFV